MFKRIKEWYLKRKLNEEIRIIEAEHELAFVSRESVTFEQCVALITHEREEIKNKYS